MWNLVRTLKESGVTIILTTRYIDEAEEMADRVGVSTAAKSRLSRRRQQLLRKLGKKRLTLQLETPLAQVPAPLDAYGLDLSADGYALDVHVRRHAIGAGRDRHAAQGYRRCEHPLQGLADHAKLARRSLRRPRSGGVMNFHAVRAIYLFEMARTWRTLMQSIISPVRSTSLYFVLFGAAIGSRIREIDGISSGAFIVPGLVMLSLLRKALRCVFDLYFPKFTGTVYELLSAPVSYFELVVASWEPRRRSPSCWG